jgi:hypothetical protein
MFRCKVIKVCYSFWQIDRPASIFESLGSFTHGRDDYGPFIPGKSREDRRRVARNYLKSWHIRAVYMGAPIGVDLGFAGQAEHGMLAQGQRHVVTFERSQQLGSVLGWLLS